MSITDLLNPYFYIGAAVVLAAIGGTFYYQDRQIHHYHELFNKEHDNVVELHTVIKQMNVAQASQLKKTEKNVEAVKPRPEIVTVIKRMKEEPNPADCATPPIPEELIPYL